MNNMDFEEGIDRLKLQHLAGGDIVSKPPLYAPNNDFLYIMVDRAVQVYSTLTGERTQVLSATEELLCIEFELQVNNVLVACTVSGEVWRWNVPTGKLLGKLKLILPHEAKLKSFNLINLYDNNETACAFITTKHPECKVNWAVVETVRGTIVKTSNMELSHEDPLVAVSQLFNYIAIAQGSVISFVNFKTWRHTKSKNARQVPITVLRVHPTEELVATGDEVGRIFLWRAFFGTPQKVVTSLYHWHHTAVTSIAFSASGSRFYSSGLESVLVIWNVGNPNVRTYLPRTCAIIRHVVVSSTNTQLVLCLADNGVQILNAGDNKTKITLQEFTYVSDDKTGKNKFPVGLRLSPRTNTIVLNGRVGQLQFYSTYSRSLLYNMDIINQNRFSEESGAILYNISVTKAAFNIDWMATGEVFNDEERLPELRLKFWKYEEKTQSYTLNTNIELPHEGNFKAIEFSNDYQVDSLLCATVGDENCIKMWSLEQSDDIYKKGKVWFCIAQTTYKHLPIESISFSQDGSLLAAGFGNTLCIYKAQNLQLKAALTGNAGFDGYVRKAQVRVPKHKANSTKTDLREQRKKVIKLLSNLLEKNDEALIREIQNSIKLQGMKTQTTLLKPSEQLNQKQRAFLYSKLLQMHELNLFQKVVLYQKLGISCRVHPQCQSKMKSYLNNSVTKLALKQHRSKLNVQVPRLNLRERFKAKLRLHQHRVHQRNFDAEIMKNLVPILSVLHLNEISKERQISNGICKTNEKEKQPLTRTNVEPSRPRFATISRVQFAANEYAHLVVVCTERRVLIWNLISLRLKSVLKLSVEHLAFDAQTNLFAAFTKSHDLHVFQPKVPLPIYQRRNLPKLHGAAFLPRRYPTARSLNLDWQAQSTLYFLTDSQKIMYLGASNDAPDAPPPISFAYPAPLEELRYATFGAFAAQQVSETVVKQLQRGGPLISSNAGKNAVKSFIEMSTHTMPPLSLLCAEFVKSLVQPMGTPKSAMAIAQSTSYKVHPITVNGHADGVNENEDASINVRRNILIKKTEISRINHAPTEKLKIDTHPRSQKKLERLAELKIELEL